MRPEHPAKEFASGVRAECSVCVASALELHSIFVVKQARCFAPEEGWTRHPQVGNCGAPDSASMFTQVNFSCVNKIRLRWVTANIERMMFVCDKAVPIVDHVNALKRKTLR
jgi:hypothetical protein